MDVVVGNRSVCVCVYIKDETSSSTGGRDSHHATRVSNRVKVWRVDDSGRSIRLLLLFFNSVVSNSDHFLFFFSFDPSLNRFRL